MTSAGADRPETDPDPRKRTGEFDDAELVRKKPAPRMEPAEAPRVEPAPSPGPEPAGGNQTIGIGLPTDRNMISGTLEAFRPRLLVADAGGLKTHLITEKITTIGRRDPEATEGLCRLESDSVSSRHARILFDGDGFTIEDLGSTNQTAVNGRVLEPNVPRALPPESHLRLGGVDALFITDADPLTCKRISPDTYRHTGELLVHEGKLRNAHLRQASDEAFRELMTLGEALIRGGRISMESWAEHYRRARNGFTRSSRPGSMQRTVIVLAGILAVLVTLALVIYLATP